MSKTSIEWTEHTWNPIVGCSIVSPGCTNCYAMKMAARIEAMGGQQRYDGTTRKVNGSAVWTGKLAQAPDSTLLQPLKRHAPTTYFVNSMGDLFHEDCSDEWIDRVFAVMALSPQHTFQVLTKRAKRMRDYLTRERINEATWNAADILACELELSAYHPSSDYLMRGMAAAPWPLSNVWLGISAERQQEADQRIPLLLQTPAVVRFISAEPLLGPVDIDCPDIDWMKFPEGNGIQGDKLKIDWVIVGGESGHGARPMNPQWARDLRDQCKNASIPYFFKQWGSHVPETRGRYRKLRKSVAGRLLDGVEHNAMPGRAA